MQPIFSNSFKKVIADQSDKVSKLINRALYYADMNAQIHSLIFKDAEINYITIRNNGNISYLPKGKEQQFNENGEWKRDGRQEGKPSKVIRKLFNKKLLSILKDIDFEQFANQYKSKTDVADMTFKIVTGEDIGRIYESAETEEGESSLNGSCMNGHDREVFDIYSECEKCSMLILTKMIDGEEKLSGRALLWQTKYGLLMDRIYVAKEHYYDMFLTYATENNIMRKKNYKSYNDKTIFILPNGEEKNYDIRIETNTDFNQYPYIDTFTFGGDGYIQNTSSGTWYEYTSTSGDRDEINQTYDEINCEYIDDCDAVYISAGSRHYRDRMTHANNVVTLANGERVYEYDELLVEISGEYYLTDDDDVCYCDETDEYMLCEDCVYCDKGQHEGTWILRENGRRVDGEVYHINDITEC